MDELSSDVERRRGLRVPIRGEAVLHTSEGGCHATVENLSQSGVLLSLPCAPDLDRGSTVDVELRMLGGGGWIRGRTVRVDRVGGRWLVALEVVELDAAFRARIEGAIAAALSTVERRPVLVIDSCSDRRERLSEKLVAHGLTPLTPRTPLEAMDLLTQPQMHVDVCIVGDSFDFDSDTITEVLTDSFPWVTTEEVDDDLEDTAVRAARAWNASPVARIASAVG